MRDYYSVMVSNLQDGDILLEKSHTILGTLVGESIEKISTSPLKWYLKIDPDRPSNHNALFGHDEANNPVIYEMLADGLVATPIRHYVKLVETKTSSLKFVRLKNITKLQQRLLMDWCYDNRGVGYDFLSYITFITKIFLHVKCNIQSNKRYYCTEMVKHAYKYVENDFLSDVDFPTSLDIENRIKSTELDIVLELYNDENLKINE